MPKSHSQSRANIKFACKCGSHFYLIFAKISFTFTCQYQVCMQMWVTLQFNLCSQITSLSRVNIKFAFKCESYFHLIFVEIPFTFTFQYQVCMQMWATHFQFNLCSQIPFTFTCQYQVCIQMWVTLPFNLCWNPVHFHVPISSLHANVGHTLSRANIKFACKCESHFHLIFAKIPFTFTCQYQVFMLSILNFVWPNKIIFINKK